MVKLTKEEMAQLAPYEDHLRNAVFSRFMISPGRTAVMMMDGIYRRATGSTLRTDPVCFSCIMNVLIRLGRIYFEQKSEEEMAKKKNNKTRKKKSNETRTN